MEPFMISGFDKGLFSYLPPWKSPEDSFRVLENAYIYRGCVHTRGGMKLIARMQQFAKHVEESFSLSGAIGKNSVIITHNNNNYTDDGNGKIVGTLDVVVGTVDYETGEVFTTLVGEKLVSWAQIGDAIRGLYPFYSNNSYNLLAVSDKGICGYNYTTPFQINKVKEKLFNFDGTKTTITLTIGWEDLENVTISIGGDRCPLVNGSYSGQGYTILLTGKSLSITKTTAPAAGTPVVLEAEVIGDIFNGSGLPVSFASSQQKIFMANGVDRITIYDIEEKTLSRPPFAIQYNAFKSGTNQIQTCLLVKFWKNRLFIGNATLENAGTLNGFEESSVRWSAAYVPGSPEFSFNNFTSDVLGYGGEVTPDTQFRLFNFSEVRDLLILWFEQSAYSVSATNSVAVPFIINKINATRTTSARLSSIDLDDYTTSIGTTGMLKTEGFDVTRYGIQNPDITHLINWSNWEKVTSFLSPESAQAFTLFPSMENEAKECDSAIIYNYGEDNFSLFQFPNIHPTCGTRYRVRKDRTWQDYENDTWEDHQEETWGDLAGQEKESYIIIGSDKGGVFSLGSGFVDEDEYGQQNSIGFKLKTNSINPYISKGLEGKFGFLDIYYELVQPYPTTIKINLFLNGELSPAKTSTLILDGDQGRQLWKRIDVNLTGWGLEIEIIATLDAEVLQNNQIKFLGWCLWAEPGGVLKPFSIRRGG